jgi:hypothetical protein
MTYAYGQPHPSTAAPTFVPAAADSAAGSRPESVLSLQPSFSPINLPSGSLLARLPSRLWKDVFEEAYIDLIDFHPENLPSTPIADSSDGPDTTSDVDDDMVLFSFESFNSWLKAFTVLLQAHAWIDGRRVYYLAAHLMNMQTMVELNGWGSKVVEWDLRLRKRAARRREWALLCRPIELIAVEQSEAAVKGLPETQLASAMEPEKLGVAATLASIAKPSNIQPVKQPSVNTVEQDNLPSSSVGRSKSSGSNELTTSSSPTGDNTIESAADKAERLKHAIRKLSKETMETPMEIDVSAPLPPKQTFEAPAAIKSEGQSKLNGQPAQSLRTQDVQRGKETALNWEELGIGANSKAQETESSAQQAYVTRFRFHFIFHNP